MSRCRPKSLTEQALKRLIRLRKIESLVPHVLVRMSLPRVVSN